MISFAPMFETMRRKGITAYSIFKRGFSVATYYRMRDGNTGITSTTIAEICKLLDCTVEEVMVYIPEG